MSTQRRLLLVTYYWPPSGGPGVQRWLKMVKYLVRLGWEVTVYTPSNPEFSEKDPSLLKDVPDGVRILSRKIIEPLRAYRKFLGKKRVGDGLLAEEGTKKNRGCFSACSCGCERTSLSPMLVACGYALPYAF